ncbi:hypothetical protein N7495_007056 [Penicillium taxi]|uniref:uncharacterized protein n=1 Tax=Penicillium taxi TaxID=168475 RepID=UPI0025451B0C|nr:uncharacterized protein N7495_007056 [Penicillium taxi]KAJ5895365.1 hypothetical protein N7495_007056 [Penicillium taxi]
MPASVPDDPIVELQANLPASGFNLLRRFQDFRTAKSVQDPSGEAEPSRRSQQSSKEMLHRQGKILRQAELELEAARFRYSELVVTADFSRRALLCSEEKLRRQGEMLDEVEKKLEVTLLENCELVAKLAKLQV